MSNELEQKLASLSKYDRDRFREEAMAYEMDRRMRELERERERFEVERYRAMTMAPPPSPFLPSNLVAPFFEEMKPKKKAIDPAKLEALKGAEPYKVTERMPDMMEVITAWRAWGITSDKEGLRLKALGVSHVWEPRKMVDAVCNNKKHPAPNMTCECGVWAFKELDGLTSALNKYSDVKVLGNVQLWGRVIETENGYRAQHAYPSELWLLDDSLEELGLIYDVPVRLVR